MPGCCMDPRRLQAFCSIPKVWWKVWLVFSGTRAAFITPPQKCSSAHWSGCL